MIILNETSKAYFELINAHISKDQKVDLDKNFSSSVYGSIRHAVIEDKDTGKKIKLNGLAIASEVGELMENGLDAKIIILRLKKEMKKDRASFLSHADFLEQWVPKLK